MDALCEEEDLSLENDRSLDREFSSEGLRGARIFAVGIRREETVD